METRRLQVLSTLLGRGEPMVISVGLAREFEGSHWLQANNVHFERGFIDQPPSAETYDHPPVDR